MKRILVTGGSGFIGTNLVEHFFAAGDQVVNFDIVPPRNPSHSPLWRKGDICDRAALDRVFAEMNPETVFHLAARTDLRGRTIEDYAANTEGVSNLIRALRQSQIRFAVFASSMLVCRMGYHPRDEEDYLPGTAYGESKVSGERLVRSEAEDAFPWIIVRPTSIWGPWFAAPYRDFFSAVERGLYFHPEGRRIRRSYGFVLNTIAQLVRLAELEGGPLVGRTVYLADHEPVELKNWAETIQRALRARPIRELPLWMFKSAALAGDALKRVGVANPPISSFRLDNLLTEMIHDIAPVRSVCGNTPFSMEDGVGLTCAWLRQSKG